MRITKIHTSNCTCTVGTLHAQQNKRDQRHARHAVGFEAIRARSDRIARVVARAIGDHAGVARVVFLDLEHDLHQVRADVRDLGEDSARDSQRRRAQRFADGESDEAGARIVAGNEQQNHQHHQQFHADQHHADAHARAQRNLVNRIRFAAKAGERRPRVRERVHANAEPRHAVASRDSQHAERENHDHARHFVVQQHAEIQDHGRGDERPQQHQEFALGDQVRFAGLINQLGYFAHRAVHRQILQPHVNRHAEDQPEHAEQDSPHQQLVPVHAQKLHLRQIRQLQIGFAARAFLRASRGRSEHASSTAGAMPAVHDFPKPATESSRCLRDDLASVSSTFDFHTFVPPNGSFEIARPKLHSWNSNIGKFH